MTCVFGGVLLFSCARRIGICVALVLDQIEEPDTRVAMRPC
jgi:hypothetical protein